MMRDDYRPLLSKLLVTAALIGLFIESHESEKS
jgi:hypothetical protein